MAATPTDRRAASRGAALKLTLLAVAVAVACGRTRPTPLGAVLARADFSSEVPAAVRARLATAVSHDADLAAGDHGEAGLHVGFATADDPATGGQYLLRATVSVVRPADYELTATLNPQAVNLGTPGRPLASHAVVVTWFASGGGGRTHAGTALATLRADGRLVRLP